MTKLEAVTKFCPIAGAREENGRQVGVCCCADNCMWWRWWITPEYAKDMNDIARRNVEHNGGTYDSKDDILPTGHCGAFFAKATR